MTNTREENAADLEAEAEAKPSGTLLMAVHWMSSSKTVWW